MWQVYIPALAFKCSTVRSGMLTLAAMYLHFHHGSSGASTKWLDAANWHGTRFVEESRKQIARFDPDESDANLACARLLFVLALAFNREYRRSGLELGDPQMWTWVHMLSGLKSVHEGIVGEGQSIDETMKLEMRPLWSERAGASTPADESEVSALREYIIATRAERVSALCTFVVSFTDSLSSLQQSVCLAALQGLDHITDLIQYIEQGDIVRALGAYVAEQPPEYLRLLERRHPVALAIHGHWLMTMLLCDGLWVVRGMGRDGIDAIGKIAGENGLEGVLRWPRRGVEILDGARDTE